MNTAEVLQFPSGNGGQERRVADTDDGYTRVANELLEAVMSEDLTARQLKVFLAVMRKTYGFGKKTDRITCRVCGKVIDPFDWVNAVAKKETKLDWELKGLRGEIKDHREGLEKLKREEVNCRARIKTAQFKLNELNMGIYKAEKENG